MCYFSYVGFMVVVGFRFVGLFWLLRRFVLCYVLLVCVGISMLVVLVDCALVCCGFRVDVAEGAADLWVWQFNSVAFN